MSIGKEKGLWSKKVDGCQKGADDMFTVGPTSPCRAGARTGELFTFDGECHAIQTGSTNRGGQTGMGSIPCVGLQAFLSVILEPTDDNLFGCEEIDGIRREVSQVRDDVVIFGCHNGWAMRVFKGELLYHCSMSISRSMHYAV